MKWAHSYYRDPEWRLNVCGSREEAAREGRDTYGDESFYVAPLTLLTPAELETEGAEGPLYWVGAPEEISPEDTVEP